VSVVLTITAMQSWKALTITEAQVKVLTIMEAQMRTRIHLAEVVFSVGVCYNCFFVIYINNLEDFNFYLLSKSGKSM